MDSNTTKNKNNNIDKQRIKKPSKDNRQAYTYKLAKPLQALKDQLANDHTLDQMEASEAIQKLYTLDKYCSQIKAVNDHVSYHLQNVPKSILKSNELAESLFLQAESRMATELRDGKTLFQSLLAGTPYAKNTSAKWIPITDMNQWLSEEELTAEKIR